MHIYSPLGWFAYLQTLRGCILLSSLCSNITPKPQALASIHKNNSLDKFRGISTDAVSNIVLSIWNASSHSVFYLNITVFPVVIFFNVVGAFVNPKGILLSPIKNTLNSLVQPVCINIFTFLTHVRNKDCINYQLTPLCSKI